MYETKHFERFSSSLQSISLLVYMTKHKTFGQFQTLFLQNNMDKCFETNLEYRCKQNYLKMNSLKVIGFFITFQTFGETLANIIPKSLVHDTSSLLLLVIMVYRQLIVCFRKIHSDDFFLLSKSLLLYCV